jgi:hypothetical protein
MRNVLWFTVCGISLWANVAGADLFWSAPETGGSLTLHGNGELLPGVHFLSPAGNLVEGSAVPFDFAVEMSPTEIALGTLGGITIDGSVEMGVGARFAPADITAFEGFTDQRSIPFIAEPSARTLAGLGSLAFFAFHRRRTLNHRLHSVQTFL